MSSTYLVVYRVGLCRKLFFCDCSTHQGLHYYYSTKLK
jgi:hypothetical protein